MYVLKYLILFIILLCSFAYADIEDNSANVSIRLSYDGGTTYTSAIVKTIDCVGLGDLGDNFVVYGSSSEMWGEASWTAAELNNTNFRLRLNFTSKTATGTPAVDHVKIRIYYTLPTPNPIFVAPTPDNASTISSTFRVNVTMTTLTENCWLSYNGTGTWQNRSITISPNKTNCYTTLAGEDDGIPNGRVFEFRVYANASGNINQTDLRQVTVSSNVPSLVLNSPVNSTNYNSAGNIILNWTITDSENDLFDYFVFARNSSYYNIKDNLIAYGEHETNNTWIKNFTQLPVSSFYNGLVSLYHLDRRYALNENSTFILDMTGKNNGTINQSNKGISMSNNASFNTSGYFAGAYQFDGEDDWIKIGSNDTFWDLCINGCTISAWINTYSNSSPQVIVARMDITDNNRFFYFMKDPSLVTFNIYDDGNGSIGLAHSCGAQTKGYIFQNNEWYNVVGVYNLSDIYLYVNGKLNSTGSLDDDCSDITINSTAWRDNEDTFIGISDDSSIQYGFHGMIDEVAIWNRSLGTEEITNLYSLKNETYYWNVTTQDSSTDINNSETRQFTIHPLCWYDCYHYPTISTNVNCNQSVLTFSGEGTSTVTASITNMSSWSTTTCLVAVEGGSIFP